MISSLSELCGGWQCRLLWYYPIVACIPLYVSLCSSLCSYWLVTKSSKERWWVCIAAWDGSVMNPWVGISISASSFCLLPWAIYIYVARGWDRLMNQEGPSLYPGLRHVVHRHRGNQLLHGGAWSAQHKFPAACRLDCLKPPIWNIQNIFVTLPKQLIRLYFHLSMYMKWKAMWLPCINIQPELL